MKYLQRLEVNHTGKETAREGRPPRASLQMLPAQPRSTQQHPRADPDVRLVAADQAAGGPGAVPPGAVPDRGEACPSQRAVRGGWARRRACQCVCPCVHASTRRESGDQFNADPGEFGFLLTEDLRSNAFFSLAIPLCQDFNIFWKCVVCLAISVC